MAKQTQIDLFIELAKPDTETGISRWVSKTEFVGKYKDLMFQNGWSWGRGDGQLAKKYILERFPAHGAIEKVRTNGYNTQVSFSQAIRKDIKDYYRDKNCVMLGVCGTSVNTRIEIDHKDGRKNDLRVSDKATQKLEDFQPLCKAANDVKRQICKECKKTDKRWDAKNLKGNPYSFYDGDENYTTELGCVGCYQYDPVEYRKQSTKRIAKEASENTTDYIMKKLYGEE
ncbi:MAG: hypothetical protein J6W37_01660 [Bacteroidales bacterium]|nr:hypothetical protein [Bacteroidales bacterium]